ncbi:YciI family protein [Mucilaginibacter ginsenosidivorans]|uniref:Transcription initiation protein n=1 Tax=Mucilaginibacter ginsenosidivorans TaxID=398053 RepID=A0A5B8UZ31_9SPHI|nr:YciI family protein [Mucilaginibacter ginsenosidivorans]QEC64218.1 transcription initiation protein [Mucilaginibacter ginsenosidivorans]
MNEFVLIFRNDFRPELKFSPDEMQAIMQKWQAWMGGIAAQGKMASTGNRLGGEGKTLKPGNVITNGPYAEIKEMVGGYIIIKSDTIDEATEIAKGCPILTVGGNVEVRDIVPMNR